jgi:hypothetical protein
VNNPPGDTAKILPQAAVRNRDAALGDGTPGQSTAANPCTIVPDPSHFDARWFAAGKTDITGQKLLPQFHGVLDEHNRRLPAIQALRSAIIAAAQVELAELQNPTGTTHFRILAPILELYADAMQQKAFDAAELVARMDADRGGPVAFNPWNGWWAGPYSSNGTPYYNLHVWDATFSLNAGVGEQHIQPVTQLQAKTGWFASAGRLEAQPDTANLVDHAINVWSMANGVTGYVWKDLADPAKSKSLLHAGFLLEPNVLLWIATEEPLGGARDGQLFNLLMFVEPAFPAPSLGGRYVIRAAIGSARWNRGAMELIGKFDQINKHRGDYRQVLPLADRTSMDCAIKSDKLQGMDVDTANDVVDSTH